MDIDPSSLPRARRQTRTVSPLRFCFYLCAALGLFVVGLLLNTLIPVLRTIYLRSSRIHFDAHHPTALESGWGWGESRRNASVGEHEIVRPFFGKKEGGGVDKMDLVATLWYRPSASSINEEVVTGNEEEEDLTQDEWRPVFEKVVFSGLSPGQKKKQRAKVEVMIKKEIMIDVRDGLYGPIPADLIATYVLIPSQSHPYPIPPPLVAWDYTHFFNPTDDLPAWPMIKSTSDSTSEESPWSLVKAHFGLPRAPALTRYLEKHKTTGVSEGVEEIVEMLHMATTEEKLLLRPMLIGPRNESTRWEKPRLRTRSWITMAREEPVYDVQVFKRVMRNLDWQQKSCMRTERSFIHSLAAPEPGCDRNVGVMGHATGLLEVRNASQTSGSAAMAEDYFGDDSEESAQSQWRYPPYTTTALNLVHLSDFSDLPSEDEALEDTSENFSFQWNVGFSTSSTLKLALPIPTINEMVQLPGLHNFTEHEMATHKDRGDWWHAVLGNHHDPHNRPILRSLLYFLAGLLQSIGGLNDIHYYLTRSLTTGISLLSPLIWFGSCLFFDFAITAAEKNDWTDPQLWFVSGFNAVHLALATNLALRLEWRWGSRRWNGWIPIGVRRRRPTHSERASVRRDWEFGWRERVGFFITVLATFQVVSDLHIISASPPSAPRLKPVSNSLYTSYLYKFADISLVAIRFSEISQLILNHKSKTFGGHHPSGAYLHLVGRFCEVLPVIMHSIWGRDQMMEPFSLFSAVYLAGVAWMAWQAWEYKTVPQEDWEGE